jgi:PPE-repeat protein
MVFDFAVQPPEVISAKIYSGPGAESLQAAATAWEGLAGELQSTASNFQSVISGLTTGSWEGPSSAAAAAAAAPYVSWISTTAAQAEQTASQARAAASAYETALAATVPPAEVTANRTQLASLLQTNIFGQNTSAIAATEAEYGQFWAQDVGALFGYAGSSSAATSGLGPVGRRRGRKHDVRHHRSRNDHRTGGDRLQQFSDRRRPVQYRLHLLLHRRG